jgi:alkylated DNA repair dioxygenase AlkB
MIFEIEDIKGLYIIPDAFGDEEHDYYMEILKNESSNICFQVHMANEYGWKFLPVRNSNGIIKRNKDDYLGFPDWMDNLILHVTKKIKQFLNKDFMINHTLINKYEVGDGCHTHVDDLEFWTDFVIGASFGSSVIMKFDNGNTEISVNVPKKSIYIMLEDARYVWRHGIDFDKSDNVHGKICDRSMRISVTFREIKKDFLPE